MLGHYFVYLLLIKHIQIVINTRSWVGRHTEKHFSLMPDNRSQIQRRTEQMKNRFRKSPEFKEKYVTTINDVVDKGYLEPVPVDQRDRDDGKVWFIPHHGVYNPEKHGLEDSDTDGDVTKKVGSFLTLSEDKTLERCVFKTISAVVVEFIFLLFIKYIQIVINRDHGLEDTDTDGDVA